MSVRVESYFFDKNFLKNFLRKKLKRPEQKNFEKESFFLTDRKVFSTILSCTLFFYIKIFRKNFSRKQLEKPESFDEKKIEKVLRKKLKKFFLHPKSKKIGTKTFASKIQNKKKKEKKSRYSGRSAPPTVASDRTGPRRRQWRSPESALPRRARSSL